MQLSLSLSDIPFSRHRIASRRLQARIDNAWVACPSWEFIELFGEIIVKLKTITI
jgi:hypothetical protein